MHGVGPGSRSVGEKSPHAVQGYARNRVGTECPPYGLRPRAGRTVAPHNSTRATASFNAAKQRASSAVPTVFSIIASASSGGIALR